MTRFQSLILLALAVPLTNSGANEPARFAQIFSDHAILQREAPLKIWGFGGKEAADLEVAIGDTRVPTTRHSDGKWTAEIPPQKSDAKGKDLILIENGKQIARIGDVLIGDIWFAAGQSNMGFRVSGMLKGLPETQAWVDESVEPTIRFRRITDPVLKDRKAEARDLATGGTWEKMTPESVIQFSAVAAVFAREVESKTGVPIGIIDVSWGGKPIEPFIPGKFFSTPLLKEIHKLADEEALEDLARIRGGVIIRNPEGYPGAIFNARIAPVIPYPIRGFLWYQAESNAGRGEDPRDYRKKMAALASGWRSRWNNESLPFHFVQLPSFPPATGWIRAREEQRLALAEIPRSGMVVTIDIRGEGIHPPDKIGVGRRLARLALENESGPLYRKHRVHGGAVHVDFSHAKEGLMIGNKPGIGPAIETPKAKLDWFELAGEDGEWFSALAVIEGSKVIVTCEKVPRPIAVRYACHTSPQGGNLYNRAGLPASPFCSDLKLLPWVDQPPKQ